MRGLVGILAVLLILAVLWDAFETVILPRRVTRTLRLATAVFTLTWRSWRRLALRRLRPGGRRESFLAYYGPLSLLFLLATWAVGLVVGFALLQWALGNGLSDPLGLPGFGTDLYMSGTTFITLGLGDITPHTAGARLLTVLEAATGFAFLALIIGYVPVLYGAFSAREVDITLLDARAGSPPSGVELLRRYADYGSDEGFSRFMLDWERWAAELLESHLSYPNLAFYRSQHDNQSWLAAITAILDACALVQSGIEAMPLGPARLAFGMGRHAVADLTQVLRTVPHPPAQDRLPAADLLRIRQILAEAGIPLPEGAAAEERLRRYRAQYEPYVQALSELCLLPLPGWLPDPSASDDWQRTAWDTTDREPTPAPVVE